MRNSWLATVLGLGLLIAGCGAPGARASAPAADGVRSLIAALTQNDPAAGYALLSSQTRKQISFAEFSIRWKQTSAERNQNAKALADSIRIDATAGERAAVRLSNGRVAYLVRTGATWSLETPLVATAVAIKPRDAVQLFARAVAERDIGAILATLTKRRRDGLAQQIDGFIKGVSKHADDALSDDGPDRRTLRWDDGTTRYELILRLEDDEWRVDDIVVREVPKVEKDNGEGVLDLND